MPEVFTYILVYIHILSAFYWIGGNLLFFSFAQCMRHIFKDPSITPGFRALGKTFRVGSWIAVFLLTITGLILLFERWGGINLNMFFKLILFSLLIPLKAIHDFYTAPKGAKENPPATFFRITLWIARLNLLILLIILYFSIVFIR